MEVEVRKVYQLNKKLERIRYIQFLNYNINYIDSIQHDEPGKWDDIFRIYKNLIEDYKDEDYIDIGNQFLAMTYDGDIRLKIVKIKDDIAIATLVKKEFPWIKIEKNDKIIF